MSLNLALKMPVTEKSEYFHLSQLTRLNRNAIPQHIAIIPDGNRRWARKNLSKEEQGHREGADILMETVKAARELQVKVITFFAFSTENWARPEQEIICLMAIFTDYLLNQRDEMIRCGIKLDTIGDLVRLPSFLNQVIEETKEATRDCTDIRLVLAFNYGSRNELCRAFKLMLQDYENNHLSAEDVNEPTISRYLDTGGWCDPELLIRTSGEVRISNFLLWQISYAEIHISPVLWPEFTPQHLLNAILDYQDRNRRLGGP